MASSYDMCENICFFMKLCLITMYYRYAWTTEEWGMTDNNNSDTTGSILALYSLNNLLLNLYHCIFPSHQPVFLIARELQIATCLVSVAVS